LIYILSEYIGIIKKLAKKTPRPEAEKIYNPDANGFYIIHHKQQWAIKAIYSTFLLF